MIFVTVGTQLPFDRMIKTVDSWAGRSGADVFAQIGPGQYIPKHLKWTRTLRADECNARIQSAQAVVAHAGMGSILTALQYGKPIVVLPRRGALGEHRNDHQVTTAEHFKAQGRIRVAFDGMELEQQLDVIATAQPSARIANCASAPLIDALRNFVRGAAAGRAGEARGRSQPEPIPGVAVARV